MWVLHCSADSVLLANPQYGCSCTQKTDHCLLSGTQALPAIHDSGRPTLPQNQAVFSQLLPLPSADLSSATPFKASTVSYSCPSRLFSKTGASTHGSLASVQGEMCQKASGRHGMTERQARCGKSSPTRILHMGGELERVSMGGCVRRITRSSDSRERGLRRQEGCPIEALLQL